MTENLKVFIVEDNPECQRAIRDTVETIAGVTISDLAKSNQVARTKLRLQPVDIVLLNLHMPDGKSLETIEEIKGGAPHTEVVLLSPPDMDDPKTAIQALELGALEHLKKPSQPFSANGQREFRLRLMTIFGLVQNRKNVRRTMTRGKRPPLETAPPPNPAGTKPAAQVETPEKAVPKAAVPRYRVDVVAVAVSTGGPEALARIIPQLPSDIGVPLLIVQHMPALMTASLAESLNQKSTLTVREAVHGEEILPNVAYIAPGGKHMMVGRKSVPGQSMGKKIIELNEDPPKNSVRPSADVLFHSVAQIYGGNILAVVMTGMGNDGIEGVRAMKQVSCYCMTQSEGTCVVYGMPRAVDEADLSDEKVPLEKLAECITEIIRRTR